jgi:transposase
MTRTRKNVRAGSLSELAEEFGVSIDTLVAWIDQTTLTGMVKAGYNPFTMSRVLPPSVVAYLRKRWGND